MTYMPWGKDKCSERGASWVGDPIPEESRHHYGGASFFWRAIVICDRDRDKSVAMVCPDCNFRWGELP